MDLGRTYPQKLVLESNSQFNNDKTIFNYHNMLLDEIAGT